LSEIMDKFWLRNSNAEKRFDPKPQGFAVSKSQRVNCRVLHRV